MKAIFLIPIVTLATATALAAENYTVKSLTCTGSIAGNYSNVHESFHKVGIQFISINSVRRNQTLAPGVRVRISYAMPNGAIDTSFNNFSTQYFTSPLKKDGDKVKSGPIKMKIDSVAAVDGKIISKLTGEYRNDDTPAGSFKYNLNCDAELTERPTTTIDTTRSAVELSEANVPSSSSDPIFGKILEKARTYGFSGYDSRICFKTLRNGRQRAMVAEVSAWHSKPQLMLLGAGANVETGEFVSATDDRSSVKAKIYYQDAELSLDASTASTDSNGLLTMSGQLAHKDMSANPVPVKCYSFESGLESVR